MHRTTISAVWAILIVFAHPLACLAQGGLPHGTYNQTCQNIRLQGNTLSAYCQKVDGGWRNTSIDYRSCGDNQIVNDNGYLRCADRGPGGAWHSGGGQGGIPPGDYRRTCQNMYMESNKLSATCQKADGGWSNTSLKNINQCRTGIVNDNGNLRCAK